MKKFKEYIKGSKKILLITSKPLDPDCIASVIIMKKYLKHLKYDVTLRFPKDLDKDEIERNDYVPYFNELNSGDTRDLLASKKFDTLIILDGSHMVQFYDYKNEELPVPTFKNFKKIIQIDHHLSSGDINVTHKICNSMASSTIEIILSEVIPQDFLNKKLATLAYIGLIGDTGNFRWNFNSKTLEIASMLLNKGADPLESIENMFFNKKKDYFEALKYVLENIEYDDKLETIFLFLPTEKLINDGISDVKYKVIKDSFIYEVARNVSGYSRGIFVAEQEGKNKVKVSARGSNLNNKISLPELWKELGGNGGGHFNASGMEIEQDFEIFKVRVKKALARKLKNAK